MDRRTGCGILVLVVLVAGCTPEAVPIDTGHDHTHDHDVDVPTAVDPTTDDGYVWDLPPGFPLPVVPPDNPMSDAKVALGRHLFYDARLSGNRTQSCASCHEQALGFTDALATPLGSTGELGFRNAMPLANVAYYANLTWASPVLLTLEQQIPLPMFGEFPVELGLAGHEDARWAELEDDPTYEALFAEAFPERPDGARVDNESVVYALASFVRSLISGDAPYDRYVAGDPDALSPAARRGFELFVSERLECTHCHGTFLFSNNVAFEGLAFPERLFQNTGLYNVDGIGGYPPHDTGVHRTSGQAGDMGRFRPPSLRNVAVTAPYFHDGSAETLEEVVRVYERGGRLIEEGPYAGDGATSPYKSGFVSGFELTDGERADLIAFLESLTDDRFLTDPQHADPW